MKFKRILSCLLLCLLSFTGLFFGCKNKYDNFKIEIDGESAINLVMNSADEDSAKEVRILISNAPSKASKNISYEVSKANIVKVEKINSEYDNIARFKISALENITSYNPSCTITFKTAEGNKTCSLNVNVEIPIQNFYINKDYTPYVVTGGEDYYINTANLINFEPQNTTQRDVIYSLKDVTLGEKYGLTLTENGKMSIENYVDSTFTALPEFTVSVKSVQDPTKEKEFTVNVFKEILAEDITLAYDFNQQTTNPFNTSENKFAGEEILELENSGITFASNLDTKKSASFGIFLKNGLDFNKVKVSFEKTILNNAIIEEDNHFNTSELLNQFKIYSLNPNVDILVVKLSYYSIEEYTYAIEVPIKVLEYPTNVLINNSEKVNYNIFDHYEGNTNGQEFNVKVLQAGSFDKRFKIAVDENIFKNLEVRYKNELLDYNTLTSTVFESDSSFYIKAKNLTNSVSDVKLTFYANILESSTSIVEDELAGLIKTLNLNLTPGIRMLTYAGVFQNKNILYLQSNTNAGENNSLNLDYVINSQENEISLNEYVLLDVISGANLVEVQKDTLTNTFIITSKEQTGVVKVKLYTENGLTLDEKTIQIYNYYNKELGQVFALDTSSNNLKTVKTIEVNNGVSIENIKYYLGLAKDYNFATIKVNNPQNASVYSAKIESSSPEIINANLTSLDNLTFYLQALKETEEKAKITITLTLFNENALVNTDTFVTETIVLDNLFTYNPIEKIEKTQKQIYVIDGDNLDIDSLQKGLNILDVEKYLNIVKADNDLSTLKVEYIMPSALVLATQNNTGDYEYITEYDEEQKIEKPFKKIVFHAGKNHKFDSNGEYVFSFTIRIEDLVGSGNYHLVTLKIVLQKHIKPDGIEVLNKDGYVYLTSNQSFGQINARVYSDTLKEVTNKSLTYEIVNGKNIEVDDNGFITIKGSGIAEVLIKAKASQYVENGAYSATKTIFVVVADGSKAYPYIYNGSVEDGKFYTLNDDITIKNPLNKDTSGKDITIGGINGNFVYANFTNLNNKSAQYNLIYNGETSIFGDKLNSDLTNLNIVINSISAIAKDDFGFIAKINNTNISNVNLVFSQMSLEIAGDYNVGLMFGKNIGEINNCTVSGKIVINTKDNLAYAYNFGGLVGFNDTEGIVTSNYSYAKKSQLINFTTNLNISAKGENAVIGGVVGVNAGEIYNISAQNTISSNCSVVGGLVGKFISSTENVSDLLFKGTAYSSNTNSLVGGIAGEVTTDLTFTLLVTEFVNTTKTEFGANLKGAAVGGLFAKISGDINRIKIEYSFVNSLVSFDNYFDISGESVGALIANASNLDLKAVYSNVKLNGSSVGALIDKASSVTIEDAYSLSTGANNLVNKGNDITVDKTYSTNCAFVVSNEEVADGNYVSSNYIKVLNDINFKTGKWTVNSNLNKGLPYLVYSNNGVNTNLITVVPNSITANFVTSQLLQDNYSYGVDKNVVVISEETENIRAIIYKSNKLSYNIDELLNISTIPANADKSNIKIESSNKNVISVNNYTLNILNAGDCTITISYLNITSVQIFISVVEKVEEFRVNTKEFEILKNNTKMFNAVIKAADNVGIHFNFDKDVESSLYYNNYIIENQKIYSFDDIHIFKGLNTLEETKVNIMPFYLVEFNNLEYKVLDFNNTLNITFSVVEGATSIYSNSRSLEVVEGEAIAFDVVVNSSNRNENLVLNIENITDKIIGEEVPLNGSSEQYHSADLTILASKELDETDVNKIIYHLIIKYDNTTEKLVSDKLFLVKINPASRKDLNIKIDLLVKSSKLINVELNHYSSTSHYYDDYNSIITPSSMPNSKIVAGNLGVLNINLYPSFASIDKIEVVSSVVNGNSINFTQLAYKENEVNKIENMVVIANAESVTNGIALKLNRSVLLNDGSFNYNGNLYVSTLLPTNVDKDTIFTISIICYFNNLSESKTYSIDLTAKPLTSINLTSAKDNGFYLARGAELELHAELINFETYLEISSRNFDTEIIKNSIIGESTETPEPELKIGDNIGTEEKPVYKIIVSTDILTPSGLEMKITPNFTTIVDGNEVTSYSNSIIIKVVDFVVNDIQVENAESGILDNNLGNISTLKAKLNVTKCTTSFTQGSNEALALSNINVKINALENLISRTYSSFNIVSKNNSGNEIYTNIVEGGNYPNFTVETNSDGYLELKGKTISNTNMILRANISYKNGEVQLENSSPLEFRTPFVFNVKTYSSDDNPLPIKTYQEFIDMKEGEDYILLNDITLPNDFEGISTNIASFDGNNKIINLNGFSVTDTNTTSLGLFNNVDENTVIKNVTVNILPTLFYSGEIYYYGLNINAQNLTEFNFGVIAGTNSGVITNCKVINNNIRIINNQNQYKEVVIFVQNNENVNANVGGIVGLNNGFITNSKVGNSSSSNSIKIVATANVGGLVAVNNKKIASSSVVNTTISNSAKSKATGGFIAINNAEANIITSFVEGYVSDRTQKIDTSIKEGGVLATNSAGGFVHTNEGYIKDCYSNIKVTTNKRSAGFVYDNTQGIVETSFSASIGGVDNAQAFKPFTGNNEENIVLNNKGIIHCYYLGANLEGDDEDEYAEPANGISVIDDANMYEGFISENSSNTIWVFKEDHLPTLFDAKLEIVSERKLIENTNNASADVYNYIYINNNIGSINNPIIVSSSQEFLNALTKSSNLYSYYFNGKIINTNINYQNIQIVKDIDLSLIIDANNNKLNSTQEVQKLQDIIFAGSLNGNGMNISNITITAKNNVTNYSSFGLFKQIGVETTYNTQGNIENKYLDEDNCTAIKNVNFDINTISATLTRSVGTLAGEVINSKLYNININSQNNLTVTGANMVGAVAGRISGNSYAKGLTTNLSVQATYDNKTNEYSYNTTNSKRVYRYAYDVVKDELNSKVNFAGGLFGVVDIYETVITNYAQQSDGKSYYINANIVRENINSIENAHIQYVKTTGEIKIQGDVVGGLFGYVGAGSIVYNAKFILINSNTQNLIADYAVGGIAGINSGYITYATVEHEKELQIEFDKDEKVSSSSIFENPNNKALIVGGLVGMLNNGRLTNSYSKANVIAPYSQYVGAIVGQYSKSKLHHVYAVSNIIAQSEVIASNGLVAQNKGYAGLIGLVSSVDLASTISNVVFVNKNTKIPTDFALAGLIGYNNAINVTVTGETSSETLDLQLTYGNSIIDPTDNIVTNNYEFYLNKNADSFRAYRGDDCWYVPLITDEEVYPILVYNKMGTMTSLTTEEDLRNMLNGGTYVLTSDIFLSKPWEPMSFQNGSLSSAERSTQEEILARGRYYKIYNLNINSTISTTGFFSNTTNSTITNVGFVVGSTYKDYSASQYKLLKESEFENDTEWNKYVSGGIMVMNGALNSFDNQLSLAVVSGNDNRSTFNNLSVEFKTGSSINTNIQNVGVIVGNANKSNIINCNVINAKINHFAANLNSNVINYDKRNTQNIGVIVGNGTDIEQFNGNSVTNAIINATGTDKNKVHIGFIAGNLKMRKNDNANIQDISIIGENNNISYNGGSSIYAGAFAGSIFSENNIETINVLNTNINIITSKNLSEIYVGGLFGYAEINSMQNIVLNSTNKLDINTQNSENAQNLTFIGGIFGYAQSSDKGNNGEVINLYNSNILELKLRTKSNTYVGGIIGQNGEYDITPINLENVISKTYINNKEGSTTNVQQNFGGIIGKNWKGILSNVYNIGKARLIIPSFNKVGAIIGSNVNIIDGRENTTSAFDNEKDNSIFIEDLNQIPARKIEFGKAISYSDFIEIVNNNDSKFIEILKEICLTLLEIESSNEYKITVEDVDFNGENLSFASASLYNPIEVKDINTFNNNEDITITENTYFVLNDNITLNSEDDFIINSNGSSLFIGNLLGNGYTINLNKTFASDISEKSLISSVVFNVKSSDTITINDINYNKNIKNVIASKNNGTIYNVATIGKIFIEANADIAPIVLKNEGYICNVISNNDILIRTVEELYVNVSGFVNINTATIYNSISSGNIEVFSGQKGSLDYNNEYKVNFVNKHLPKIAGLANENSTFITNVVTTTTLPEKQSGTYAERNYDIKNIDRTGLTINCYTDYFSNGNYQALGDGAYNEKDDRFISTQDLINKISKEKCFASSWTQSLGILYGYNYPILSIYSDKDFLKDNLSTIENGEMLINNFGVFNYTIDTMLADKAVDKINLKQIRSFRGRIQSAYKISVDATTRLDYDRYTYVTKNITKSLTYDGNGFVITGLLSNAKIEDESKNIYAGLFYNINETDAKGNNIEINILNLAITDATFETKKKLESADDDKSLQGNVYLGAIIAKSVANVTLTGCYIDGSLNIDDAKCQDRKNSDLIVGGLVGDIKTGTIENNVSNVKISLKKLKYSSAPSNETNPESLVTFYGFNSVVGGILGRATDNAVVNNNYNFKDILVSTSVSLNLGGIVGSLGGGSELRNNLTISKPAYNGAYLSYYAESDSLTYNINAVIGKVEKVEDDSTITCEDNKYNKLINFVTDNNINEETTLNELVNALELAYGSNFNKFMATGPSQMVKMPNIITLDGTTNEFITSENNKYTLKLQNDTIYIGTLDENSNVDFNVEDITTFDILNARYNVELSNTTIIFENKVKYNVSENKKAIFDKLINCTISNIDFYSGEDTILTNAILANQIDNVQIYDINVNNVYLQHKGYRENQTAFYNQMGMLVNQAKNSYLNKININKGRFEVNDVSQRSCIGAIVGYAENTLIQESNNDATITVYYTSKRESKVDQYIAGILGFGDSSSVFKCNNNALIYVKDYNDGSQYVSGIANMMGSESSTISFCINNGQIKGVNYTLTGSSTINLVSGIGSKATVLYSINKGKLISVSSSNISISNGIGASNIVYFSYNMGSIVSNNRIYAITDGTSIANFNIGNGYTDNSVKLSMAQSAQHSFALTEISARQMQEKGDFYNILSTNTAKIKLDSQNDADGKAIKGSNDIFAYNVGSTAKPQYLVCIRAIEDGFSLRTETRIENGKETEYYLIGTPFELWFWAAFNKGGNVLLEKDIDLRGFEWNPVNLSGIFNGQNHTIKNLTFKNNIKNVGFIKENRGKIKNINFENPKYKLNQRTTKVSGGEYYISIVASKNYGTIDNIMISSTNGESFVEVWLEGSVATEDLDLYLGLATAYNAIDSGNSVVSNVEVICLDNYAINSIVRLKGGAGVFARADIKLYIGGIVGYNNGRDGTIGEKYSANISHCVFIGTISSELYNNTYWGDLADNNVVGPLVDSVGSAFGLDSETSRNLANELMFAYFGFAHQYVGKIVGAVSTAGSSSITNCYATISGGEDNFLIASNQNPQNFKTHGNTALLYVNSTVVVGANAGKAALHIRKIKKLSKAGDFVDAMKTLKLSNPAFAIASIAYEIPQTINNTNSFRFNVDYDYSPDHAKKAGGNYSTYNFKSPYVNLFSTGFAANTTIYENMEKYFGEGDTFPLNASFLKLSNLKEVVEPVNNTYYVYNAQQLAHALTQENDNNIVLMDNIDMSNRIWDDGLKISGNHTISTNGFKVLLGGNNSNADLKTALPDVCYDNVTTIKDINEYGYLDDVSENKTETAYNNFKTNFAKNYDGNVNNCIVTDGDKEYYHINNLTQLEVIADALNTYTYGENITHAGIDLSDINFVLDNDLDLSNSNIKTLDSYSYSLAYKKDKTSKTVQRCSIEEFNALPNDDTKHYFMVQTKDLTKEEDNITDELLTKQQILNNDPNVEVIYKYCTPEFLEPNNTQVLTLSTNGVELKNFNATFDGNGHTITLNNNFGLFNAITSKASVKNVTIKPNSNSINLTKVKSTDFGFVANYNEGTIENITIDGSNLNGTLSFEYDIDYKILETYIRDEKTEGLQLFNIGLISGLNYGTIKNITIKDATNEGNLIIFNNLEFSNRKPTEYVSTKYSFALIAGINQGTISSVNLDSYNVKFNKFNDDDYNKGGTYSLGLISAENYLNMSNISNCKLEDITITNSSISLDNFIEDTEVSTGETITVKDENGKDYTSDISYNKKGDSIGLISAYSELGLTNCLVINSSVNTFDAEGDRLDNNYLFGQLTPTLYSVNRNIAGTNKENSEETKTISIQIITAYIPKIEGTISQVPLVKNYVKYAVTKAPEKTDGGKTSSDLLICETTDENGVDKYVKADNDIVIEYFIKDITDNKINNITFTNYEKKEIKSDDGTNQTTITYDLVDNGVIDNLKADNDSIYDTTGSVFDPETKEYKDCKAISLSIENGIKFEFATTVNWNLKDASGNEISGIKKEDYSQELQNENYYFVLFKDGEKLCIINNGTLYASNDVQSLGDLGITVKYFAGDENNLQDTSGSLTQVSGDKYFVNIGGAKFLISSKLSWETSINNRNYTFNLTYSNELCSIEIEDNENFGQLLNRIPNFNDGQIKDIMFDLIDGYENWIDMSNAIVTPNAYKILYNYDTDTQSYLNSFMLQLFKLSETTN